MRDGHGGISRRAFARGAGAAAISAASYARALGANERVGVGYIGFGLIGKRHVLDFKDLEDVNNVGVAEAHSGRRDEACALIGGKVEGYSDFRKLLDRKDVDAVVVSTPDHWHALMAMMACDAGKDVYVEKPTTLFVREGRWMLDVAKRTKRVVIVGTQQRSGPHYQRARELVHQGRIGRVVGVRMASYRNIMPGFGTPPDTTPPPELDWEMWLGPTAYHRYNPNRGIYHFRWFWDTSGGQMTNLGQHALDIVYWFLDLDAPRAVTSVGGRFALKDNGETPDTQDALFEFPGLVVGWEHREVSRGQETMGLLEFQGTDGTMVVNRRGFEIVPDRQIDPSAAVPRFGQSHPTGGPPKTDQAAPNRNAGGFRTEPLKDTSGNEYDQFRRHARHFLDCIKSRQTPVSDLDSGHRVVTACHLANLSLRLGGRRLRWDAANETIPGDSEAAAMLERPYRSPWDAVRDRVLKG
ncbi:MAG TPA: Gfo/Idh/MocA family oxidoreductase [Isosphaeraceae bacterium]|jgi:predicted dehydrogenase|nr:Gfo/Idh/MocA family oxidoreductase [Isosphaeraceae bacterium]